jgi:hypothetical protein
MSSPSTYDLCRANKLSFFHHNAQMKSKKLSHFYTIKLLKFEINDSHLYLKFLRSKLFKFTKILYNVLPNNLCCRFLNGQKIKASKLWQLSYNRIMKKLNNLRDTKIKELKSMIPSIYFNNLSQMATPKLLLILI